MYVCGLLRAGLISRLKKSPVAIRENRYLHAVGFLCVNCADNMQSRIYICLFCFAKYLLGAPKPLNCIPWMQAVLSKQKGKLFYFLRNSPYSHSANADIIALYLLVSSNKEEKVSCASR